MIVYTRVIWLINIDIIHGNWYGKNTWINYQHWLFIIQLLITNWIAINRYIYIYYGILIAIQLVYGISICSWLGFIHRLHGDSESKRFSPLLWQHYYGFTNWCSNGVIAIIGLLMVICFIVKLILIHHQFHLWSLRFL